MTIQLPVLLWTVICFCILMLVLNKLLFEPLLSFMDERSAKIERARIAREAAVQAHLKAQQDAEEARRAAQKLAYDDAAAALDAARNAAAQEGFKQEQAYAAQLAQMQIEIEAEKQALLQKLNDGIEVLVSAFTEKLVQ